MFLSLLCRIYISLNNNEVYALPFLGLHAIPNSPRILIAGLQAHISRRSVYLHIVWLGLCTWKFLSITCPGNVCPGKWLSGKCLVRETTCPGNVLSGKRLARKVIVRETSVKLSVL